MAINKINKPIQKVEQYAGVRDHTINFPDCVPCISLVIKVNKSITRWASCNPNTASIYIFGIANQKALQQEERSEKKKSSNSINEITSSDTEVQPMLLISRINKPNPFGLNLNISLSLTSINQCFFIQKSTQHRLNTSNSNKSMEILYHIPFHQKLPS